MSDLMLIGIITIIVMIAVGLIYMATIGSAGKTKKKPQVQKKKGRDAIIKEANRRLAANPKDPAGLQTLADLYFSENDFDKAMKTYQVLCTMASGDSGLDEYLFNLRYGLSALKCGQHDEALKSLLVAKSLKGDGFEVNYNLGYLEFTKKNFDKAVVLLKQAIIQAADHPGTTKYLGQALFKNKQYKEAASYLRRALDQDPGDKETLFFLGQTFFELGQSDNAVKIFTHLRTDGEFGPQAALFAGTIHFNMRQWDRAIEDLEIGLKHQKIAPDVLMEMKYRVATSYTQTQNVEMSLKHLKELRNINPSYKDVTEQIRKLSEFSSNRNLQVFMMAPTSEFVTLCRNLVASFFPQATIKYTDVTVNKNEYADITCEISTSKWEDIILFRFIRSNAQIGELFLRDMQVRIKEVRAGRGFCVTAGNFTQTAKQYVEARLIDLVEKEALLKTMSTLAQN